jgi:hypothetical protein
MKKNEIDLSLVISDFNDITHDEITQLLGIEPTFIRIKGEKKNPKRSDSPLIQSNKWAVNSRQDKYANFDEHMTSLLDIIEPKIDALKPICEKYGCEISCGMFVYFGNSESTPWVHMDSRYNNIVRVLNIEFDLDLYVWPTTELQPIRP